MNMSSPISTSFAMEIVPSDMRATASSTMNMGDSLARSASQILGGIMMDTWGNSSPYYFTCVLYFAASVFYWWAFRNMTSRANEADQKRGCSKMEICCSPVY